jgi:hypothetical protein
MLNIALAIYAGETRYNIIQMNPYGFGSLENSHLDSQIPAILDAKDYRIFSQVR